MTNRFNCIEDVTDYLSLTDTEHTLENLVDHLVELGRQEHVFAFHDDFLGLKANLPRELLGLKLEDVFELESQDEQDQDQKYLFNILEEANIIIDLDEKPITEERQWQIDEDKMERGADDD